MSALSQHWRNFRITMQQLVFNDQTQRLELISQDKAKQKSFYIDFCEGKMAHRLQQGVGRKQPLARAVGIKKDYLPSVLDVTAGLGRDAFLLASCGCEVMALERNETMYQLLQDGLQRASQDDKLREIIARLQLKNISGHRYLESLKQDIPDVIYLDPMYPLRKSSALVKQEMRIVREVVGDDKDTESLFELALHKAKQRVIVKRHHDTPPLMHQRPSHSIEGKTTRFDVYMMLQN